MGLGDTRPPTQDRCTREPSPRTPAIRGHAQDEACQSALCAPRARLWASASCGKVGILPDDLIQAPPDTHQGHIS